MIFRFCSFRLLLAGLFVPLLGYGQVLLEENFDYPAATNVTLYGWSAFSSAGISPVQVSAIGLSYGGYTSSGIGGGMQIAAVNGEDVERPLPGIPVTSVYTGFLLNVTSAGSGALLMNFSGNGSGSANSAGLMIRTSGGGFQLGLGGGYGGTVYSYGQTYLVVVEYASTSDYYLYVDPVIGGAKPGATFTYHHAGSAHTTIFSLRTYQNATAASAMVDGIRVSSTWCDIVGNCPVTSPLPLVDYFDYGGGELSTSGWNQFYSFGPMPVMNSAGLEYPGFSNLNGGGDAVMLMGCCSSYGVNKLFTPVFGGAVYASFLLRYTFDGGSTGEASIGFYSSTAMAEQNQEQGFYIGNDRGRIKHGTCGACNSSGGPLLNPNTTYLVVLKYDLGPDLFSFWINPVVGSVTEPAPDYSENFDAPTYSSIDGISIMNNGESEHMIDRLKVTTSWAEAVALEPPANPPTNLVFSSISQNQVNGSFNSSVSQPTNYIVVRGIGSPPTSAPVDDTQYFAGQTVGDATIVSAGGGTNFSEFSLDAGTTYYYNVHGFNYYNGGPTLYRYGSALQGVVTTEPGSLASNPVFTNVQTNQMDVSFTAAPSGVTGYLVTRNTFVNSDNPVDGTTYTPGGLINSSFVVYSGTGTNFTDTGLMPNTNYIYQVYSYAGSGSNINYSTSYNGGNNYTLSPEPTNQPTGLLFGTVTTTSIGASFTAAGGGATGYLVLRRLGVSPTEVPVDGVTYSLGSSLGSSVVAAFGGSTSFNDAGLTSSSIYFYDIFSYNTNGVGVPNYRPVAPLEGSRGTLFPQPGQASVITFSAVGSTTMTVGWTIGTGAHRTVVAREGTAVTFTPTDGNAYTPNANYTAGTDLGGGKVVYSGNGTSVNLTGLTPGAVYHFRVYESNPDPASNQSNYNPNTAAGNPASQTVLATEPVTQATNLTFASVQANSLTLNWTSGSGANRIVVMDDAAVGFTPSDATDYTANSNYALGTDLGSGQKCVYNGAGATVAITGLSPNVTYHFRVFEYNGSSLTTNYYTATATGNPNSRITLVAEPTTQASSIVFTPAATTSLNFNWSNGNGAGRVVVARAGSAVDTDPADGSTYTANLTFGSGSQIGTGNYIVFSGTGTGPITVGGLTQGATYHFRVYEYNGTTIQTNYNSATASGNPNSATTLAAEPTLQASSILFSSVTTTSATLTWTNGNGATRLVLAKAGAAVDTNPTDANNYTPSTTFGSGTQLGTGNYAVYLNNGNSVTVTGLTAGTTYHFRVYEMNGAPPATNYLISAATGNPANVGTLFIEPTTQASAITFSSPLTNGFTASWTNGNGSNRIVIVDDAAITFTPTDGVVVAANADYSAGTDLGGGQKCVYNGSGNSVAVSGLSANTTYFIRVYEYNGTASQINYNVATGTGNPGSRKTLVAEPAGHAASFAATASSSSQNSLSFSAASSIPAAGYIILRRSDGTDPATTGVNDGVSPASLPLTAGTTLLTTITSTSATGFNDTGLPSGIQFNYALIPYGFDGANNETYNYRTSPVVPLANATTFVVEPPAQPTAMAFSSLAPTTFNVAWVPPGTAPAGYLVLRKPGSSPTGVPVDGTAYTMGNPLGDGTIVYLGATPSFSESGLTAASLYFYDVFAFNGAGGLTNYLNAGPLEGSQTTLSNPPANQPTALAFASVTATTYDVSFTSSAGGATGYLVVRRTGAAPSGIPANGTSYVVGDPLGDGAVVFVGAGISFSESALSSNTTYHYAVFAYNGSGGNTHYLTSAPLSGSQLTLPQAPNALTASSPGQTSFTANWDAIAGITNFFIDVSSDNFSTFATGFQNQLVTGTSVSVTGLTPGTTYKYRMRAGNATGQSANSNEQSVLLIPATPVAVAGTSVSQTGFTANWNAVNGAANYYIDVSTQSNFSTFLTGLNDKQLGSGVTSEIVTGLVAGTTYYYRVRASNGTGVTVSSNAISQVTIPGIPANLVAPDATTSSTSFLAEWDAVSGADGYEIDVSRDNFATYATGYQGKQIVGGSLTNEVVTGLLGNTIYRFRVRSYNSGGVSPSSPSKAVLTKGGVTTPPDVAVIDNQNSMTQVSASVSGGVGNKTIVFYHRKVSETNFTAETAVSANGSRVDFAITAALLDEVGMEYYFILTDEIDQSDESTRQFVYQSVSNATIPDLATGGTRSTYRIFSIPVDLGSGNNIEDVFASVIAQFAGYNKEKWRLVRWQGGKNVDYTEGLTRIDKGKGYWFNSVEAIDLDISGMVIPVSQTSPFQLQLEDGWNQIGNPFTFGISWSDVLAKNPTKTGVGPLYVYNPTAVKFDQSNTLKAWGGGFVRSDGATTIDIPVTVARASGRSGGPDPLPSDLSGETWFLPLKLEQGITFNDISGIGMSPEASVSKDRLDELSLPRFVNYLELNGHHPEYKWPRFMRDVVPAANSFTWDLKVESNFEGPEITLSWDRSSFGDNEAMLVLFDKEAQTLVDMRVSDSYTFENRSERSFKIVYARSPKDFRPDFTGAGAAYPNPFSTEVLLPVITGKGAGPIGFTVTDMMGRRVASGSSEALSPGLHTLRWDGRDPGGSVLPDGMYVYRVTSGGSLLRQGRIIHRKN